MHAPASNPCIFIVPPEEGSVRLDRFLTGQLPQLSRARIQELIQQGQVQVAGRTAGKASETLKGGEQVAIAVSARPQPSLEPEALPLDVLYEDDDLAAINKPAGLVVHPGAGRSGGTLVNALLHRFEHLSGRGQAPLVVAETFAVPSAAFEQEGSPDASDEELTPLTDRALRPGIVHRLDRDTSGVLVIAKNDWAHQRLAAQFQARTVRKQYLALVHGRVPTEQGRVDAPIDRDRFNRVRMTTKRRSGREAHTLYTVLERFVGLPGISAAPGGVQTSGQKGSVRAARQPVHYTWLSVQILTGRTHQIRVHLASIGHPVAGDRLYGAPAVLAGPGDWTGRGLSRVFLHSAELRLQHPRSAAELVFQAPLPDELKQWLNELRAQGTGLNKA